jgi:hypothetical protein
MMQATKDKEIRLALHDKKLRAYREAPDTIVVDELGLSHARARIDVAVINGCVHGYEIKSSLDSLDRLPSQLALYSQCLEKLTLVCAPRHTGGIEKIAPEWCGILEVEKGKRGGMKFHTIRRPLANPEIDAVQLAHLLWRPEAAELLARHGASKKMQKKSRKELYVSLAELLTIQELTAAIREFMKSRRAWRDPRAHA